MLRPEESALFQYFFLKLFFSHRFEALSNINIKFSMFTFALPYQLRLNVSKKCQQPEHIRRVELLETNSVTKSDTSSICLNEKKNANSCSYIPESMFY